MIPHLLHLQLVQTLQLFQVQVQQSFAEVELVVELLHSAFHFVVLTGVVLPLVGGVGCLSVAEVWRLGGRLDGSDGGRAPEGGAPTTPSCALVTTRIASCLAPAILRVSKSLYQRNINFFSCFLS